MDFLAGFLCEKPGKRLDFKGNILPNKLKLWFKSYN